MSKGKNYEVLHETDEYLSIRFSNLYDIIEQVKATKKLLDELNRKTIAFYVSSPQGEFSEFLISVEKETSPELILDEYLALKVHDSFCNDGKCEISCKHYIGPFPEPIDSQTNDLIKILEAAEQREDVVYLSLIHI